MAIDLKQNYFEIEYDLSQGWVKHNAIKCKSGETGRGVHITITNNGNIQIPIEGALKFRYQTSNNTYSNEIGIISGSGYDVLLDNLLLVLDMEVIKSDIEVTISEKKISSRTLNIYIT